MDHRALSEFADKMNEFMPLIMKEFGRRVSELYKGKITFPQVLIMSFLSKNGESKMTDIAHFMGVSAAAMTGIVDRLGKSGYVVRTHDLDDRRIIKIKPTAKGSALMKKVNTQRKQMIINIFRKITEEDRDIYMKILTQIHNTLMEEHGEGPQEKA